MKQSFKLALASLALAAVLAVAPVLSVSSYAADAAPTAAAPAADAKVTVDGDNVSVVGADGVAKPASDGMHVTKDGKTVNVKGGKLVK